MRFKTISWDFDVSEESKVNLAKHCLSVGDLPISRVAWLLGYSEISSVTHAFRRWTGATPASFGSGQPNASRAE